MPRKRPTAVLVIAVLNLVFGASNLLCVLCAGAGVGFLALALGQPGAARDPAVGDLKEALASASREVPLLVPVWVGDAVVSLVLAVVMVVAGLGLLGMRRWARVLSIVYGVATLLAQTTSLAVHFLLLNPALDRWEQGFQARPAPGRAGPMSLAGNGLLGNSLVLFNALTDIVYAAAVLVVMFLPSIAPAFAGRGTGEPAEPVDTDLDGDEEMYDRRRAGRGGQDGGW
jgi:hypothetical protein